MKLSKELQEGLDALGDLPEYRQLDINFDKSRGFWVLHFRLNSDIFPNKYVPAETNWHALVSKYYPYGMLALYPDRINGIQHTFQHQIYNEAGNDPWRKGNICVRTKLASWEQRGLDVEPRKSVNRLRWHIERALYWLECAATNRLTLPGDPFELPDIPIVEPSKIIFQETTETFATWMDIEERVGKVTAKFLHPSSDHLLIQEFKAGAKIITSRWGFYLSRPTGKEQTGVWVRMNSVPVLHPWEIPSTWKGLKEIGESQGLDVIRLLQNRFINGLGAIPNFILFGFPIPRNVGEAPEQLYWIGCLFPELPPFKGFRPGSKQYLEFAAKTMFSHKRIMWMRSENWAKQQITARGLLHQPLLGKNILLVGAGAVGSILAELLVRLGMEKITIVDGDILAIGNFSRHNLTMEELEKHKAEALAARLNSIFPDVHAHYFNQSLSARLYRDPEFVCNFDLVIDATGADEVLHILQQVMQAPQKLVSLSTGIKANRLYAYCTGKFDQLKEYFDEKMAPWMTKDLEEKKGLKLPMEGIGCWHPLFPARYDSIMMLTAASISKIENYLSADSMEPELVVIEKQLEEDLLTSIRIIKESE